MKLVIGAIFIYLLQKLRKGISGFPQHCFPSNLLEGKKKCRQMLTSVGLCTYQVPQLLVCKYRKMHNIKQDPISCSAKCLHRTSDQPDYRNTGLKYKKELVIFPITSSQVKLIISQLWNRLYSSENKDNVHNCPKQLSKKVVYVKGGFARK